MIVVDQVTGLHAERLASARNVTVAFDYRDFGESGGLLNTRGSVSRLVVMARCRV